MTAQYPPRHTWHSGKPQPSPKSSSFQSINPANGTVLADIHTSSAAEISSAISSASKAFPIWSSISPLERSAILHRAVALLRERNNALATIETHDTGKPFSETSTVDIATGADVLAYYASLIASGGLDGTTTVLRSTARSFTTPSPLGVCAAIGAWNYPIQIALWKLAPCLAAGNTLVYKPSEVTPLHAQPLAELLAEAGLPPGVFNIVYGPGSVGANLIQDPRIMKVSFTGQVSTGRKVASSAAESLRYVTMELGGKSPCIVVEDCDIELAVDGAMMANFFSSGQVCTNGTRVFVPRSLKARFEQRLLEKMRFVRAGDVMDPNVNFGPLVSRAHYDKVLGYIRHGVEVDKAKLIYGGPGKPVLPAGADEKGLWVRPTVFTDCTDEMRITTEEIFGPVMCILYYDSVDEVIRRANSTSLGLAAGVFTKNIDLAHNLVSRLEAGITWINTWGESPAEMPVGGWKLSGVGVENGRKGLDNWLQNKSTLIDTGGSVATVFAQLAKL